MGQKINSNSMRLGINKPWKSKWFDRSSNYAKLIHEDLCIRKYIISVLSNLNLLLADLVIKRARGKVLIELSVYSVKTGDFESIEEYKHKLITNLSKITKSEVILSILKTNNYTNSSLLLANYIADQLQKRKSYREIFRKVLQDIKANSNIKGVRINCSGRLDGAEIARTEWIKSGQISLHTIDANVNYASARASTIYGICGVKTWVCYK